MNDADSRETRANLIAAIEEKRESKVLAYCTSDRPGPIPAQIGEDAVSPLYHHLLEMDGLDEAPKKVDLFLYTRGGDVSVPWRIVNMIREFCEEFSVLIPYKAHSAGTMIALGADSIVAGRKAELSPIDPILSGSSGQGDISVEDVSSYLSFLQERAKITDQAALAAVITALAQQITPLALGSVNRQHSHIRLVARKLLTSRHEKIEEDKIVAITEGLTEKMYSHGHAIGRDEAIELGLSVKKANKELEKDLWDLFAAYKGLMNLDSPLHPEKILRDKCVDEHTEKDLRLAVIESKSKLDIFETDLLIKHKRTVPQQPQINLNLNVQLPPGIDPNNPNMQRVVQQVTNDLAQALPQLVQQEIVKQSPIAGIECRTIGGQWISKQ